MAALSGTAVVVGFAAGLSLAGVPRLVPLALHWRRLFGFGALPIALGLLAAGVWLQGHGDTDPWRLPWGRALAVEAALVATLALLASTFGPNAAGEAGPGGQVGWALAKASGDAIGPLPAVLLWLTVGSVGLLAASGLSTRQLATGLARAADWLAEGSAGAADAEAESPAPARAAPAAEPPGPARQALQALADQVAMPAPAARPPATRASRSAGARPVVIQAGPPATPRGAKGRSGFGQHLPQAAMLGDEPSGAVEEATLRAIAEKIERTLEAFGVPAKVVQIERGPTVTRFGLQPGTVERSGRRLRVTVARVVALKDDLALALAARSLRIEAPVPGRPVIGVEIPNPETRLVGLKRLVEDPAFGRASRKSPLVLALGRDVSGAAVIADLGAMPHLLVAGATGSGKSVCLHSVLASLLFQNTPDALRVVLIDPKRVEFGRYKRLPHLLGPVVTDLPEVVGALRWVVIEMDHRYRAFALRGVRDRAGYNARSPAGEAPLPALLVVIDELADPMLTAPEETEPLLMRLAQLGRATGIHLVVATQRPSTDVVTGVIKANFPARIAFAVASNTDSRVILDTPGAETLLGRGDMLYQAPDAARPRRAQGTFVSDDEIGSVVDFWIGSPWSAPIGAPPWADLVQPLDAEERLYRAAVELAGRIDVVNASLLQRRLRIGYRKARELMDRLEDDGLVGVDTADETEPDVGADLDWVDDEFEIP